MKANNKNKPPMKTRENNPNMKVGISKQGSDGDDN